VSALRVRWPAVAGAFYPSDPVKLREAIIECFHHPLGPGRTPQGKRPPSIVSVVVPHAGYIYSGPAAAHAYLELGDESPPDAYVVVGPNHTGWGTPLSIMEEGVWRTPLGDAPIDSGLAEAIIEFSEIARADSEAFIREHSQEVQVPFIQFINPKAQIVPVCMGYQDLETSRDLAQAVFKAAEGKRVVVVASTDLSHQEPIEVARRKDALVLEALRGMDEERLQRAVRTHRISMCGYGPASVALVYAKLSSARECQVLTYYTSGDVTGDTWGVVGYTSAKIVKEE